MNEDVKNEWVDALLYGGYEQGTNILRASNDKFCCLGVLCDLAVRHGVLPQPMHNGFYWSYGEGESGVLPVAVQVWAGLDHWDPPITFTKDNETYKTLSAANDYGLTFDEIADIIKNQL